MTKYITEKKRIVILCEGDTEFNAVEYFIRPQWERDNLTSVGLKPVNLRGNIEKIFRIVQIYDIEKHTKAIFTLIDLYGLKKNMYNLSDETRLKVEKLIKWLKDEFEEGILDKFHPHLAVHETEAWFLAEEKVLSKMLGTKIKRFSNPESINFEDHPSKRLNKLFLKNLQRRYIKGGLYGDDRKMFENMILEKTAEKCPYLKAFYNDLKTTAMKFI